MAPHALNPSAASMLHESAPTSVGATCSHCGLDATVAMIADGENVFCCGGCQIAHHASQELGATCPTPANRQRTLDAFAFFDDPAFQLHVVTTDAGGLAHATLALRGMHCATCVWTIEELPQRLDGLVESRTDFRRGRLTLTWQPDRLKLSTIASTLAGFGYRVAPLGQAADEAARRAEDRRQMIRLAVAGACAGNAMLLAVALYAGVFDGMAPEYVTLFRWSSLGVTIISLLWPGTVFFRSAWAAARARSINFDAPIALALGAGGLWSLYSTIIGKGEIYFDSVSVLIFALLVGRYVQHRQQRWAADSVELLFTLTPQSALRVVAAQGGTAETLEPVSVLSLSVGDIVAVFPGDSIPVDGVIVKGSTAIDQSLLTGESLPRSVGLDEEVFAGSVNLSGTIHLRTLRSGQETRIGKLMELVQDASSRRAPIVRIADRVGGYFMVAMLAIAACTFIAWLPLGASHAVETTVALLVVTCPCALGLATPLAFTIAIGRAARRGILIKGGDCLQHLAGKGVLFLDKTGTLTAGTMQVVAWHGPVSLKPLVAALEAHSTHPVGRALSQLIDESRPVVLNVVHTQGSGIEGMWNGQSLRIGSPTFIGTSSDPVPTEFESFVQLHTTRGLTVVLVSLDRNVVAAAAVGDQLRPQASETVASLRSLGWDCRVLSGDDPRTVAAIASECGIAEFEGGLTPEQKLEYINAARTHGAVVMVGDGVNDAAALAAASVGIAVQGGAQASLAAANVYLSKPGLGSLLDLVLAGRRTMGVVRLALVSSVLYNLTAGTIAVTGHMSPIIAALVMPLSSITAVSLCVAVRTFRDRPIGSKS